MPMKIHIREGDIHLIDLQTRIPFKYGIATMTRAPHAFVRLRAEIDGELATGIAADLLPPKWFTKDPAKPLDAEVDEMLRVIENALELATDLRADSPFDAWRQLYDAQAEWGRRENLPPLLANFGTSLVERALIHAACQSFGVSFAVMVAMNVWSLDLGAVHPMLARAQPSAYLPIRPLERIVARHTVGLADALEDADIPAAERLDDGLPQSLAACTRAYGLRHFKIKISGDIDRDSDRLRRAAGVISALAPAVFAFSLDGNEQFRVLEEFRAFWEAITTPAELQPFFQHLLFVEQPFHRDMALQPEALAGLDKWLRRPPLIIDESDAQLDSLPRALELGYAGTSHKNCKGVFRSIANACLLAQLRRDQPGRLLLHSGEDLANIGPVALLQDLAVCAALGIASVERNGHHYFAGLSMFPQDVQEHIVTDHCDLYRRSRHGWPTLAIDDGSIDVSSVNAAAFGIGAWLNVEQFTPLDAWRRAHRS
jgi:hypothetical protein